MYAGSNLEGCALQLDALLETEGGEVLGVLVQDFSVENLITGWIVKQSLRGQNLGKDSPDDQSSSCSDVLPIPERILGQRGDWEVELCETWGGGNCDWHCLEASR